MVLTLFAVAVGERDSKLSESVIPVTDNLKAPRFLCIGQSFRYSPESAFYTGCNRRNGPDFGRVFLMLNYTEKPQNTYIQSSMVTEIQAREKCGLLWCLRTVLYL